MDRRKYRDSAPAVETPARQEIEIDVGRVVWDVEYREQVMAALRRREGARDAAGRKRPKHGRRDGGKSHVGPEP